VIACVADTHVGLWYLFGDSQLSPWQSKAIEAAASARRNTVISVITLAEIAYLVEKGRDSRVGRYLPTHA
jgi:PIN domain nuclease of toxin-antitoxin system